MSSAAIAAHEAEIKEYRLQLETVHLGLQADPDNAELQELKHELDQIISLTQASIAELRPTPHAVAVPVAAAPTKEKWSRENHPAFKGKAVPPPPVEEEVITGVVYKANDMVLAKWHAGDKGFYPARITSITGSSNSPIYIVKFKADGSVETLRAKDIKPIANPNKRKADGTPVAASPINAANPFTMPPPPNASNSIISATPDIDASLIQPKRREPSKVSDGPTRPAKIAKQIKKSKELNEGKSKWQAFSAKGPKGKLVGKESMFRTPEGVHGRVGFVGSGKEMRKDVGRSKHVYHMGEEEG